MRELSLLHPLHPLHVVRVGRDDGPAEPAFYRVTEDGLDDRVTEDGVDKRITESLVPPEP